MKTVSGDQAVAQLSHCVERENRDAHVEAGKGGVDALMARLHVHDPASAGVELA